VDRLVYLDSAFDYREIFDSPEARSGLTFTPQPPTPAYDDNSIADWILWAERVSGPGYPEAAVRALYEFGPEGEFVRGLSIDSVIDRLEPVDRHYLFLTHTGETIHAMREFLEER
jgi:hypothetical protein